MILCEQCNGPGVFQHKTQPFNRVSWIKRHIGTASLEHGQQCDDHLEAALDADGHPRIGLNAESYQIMRQLVSPAVQLGVTQFVAFENHCGSIGRLERLFLEQLMNTLVAGIFGFGVIPLVENLMTLLLTEHGQHIDRLGIVGNHGLEQGAEVPKIAFDGSLFEERGGILHPAHNGVACLLQGERQIELGNSVGRRFQKTEVPGREVQVFLVRCSAMRT